jgi:formylmethanofuran dehydrogenase subunit E
MVDPRRFLDAGVHLHGHTCDAMLLGLRVGAAAMNRLGAERSAEAQLLAVLEVGEDERGRCVADGVQTVTGCTLGKGNVQIRPAAPLSLTLVDQATRRAVRVTTRTKVSSTPTDATAPDALRLLRAPERRLLSVSEEFEYRPRALADDARPPGRNDAQLTGVKAGRSRGR